MLLLRREARRLGLGALAATLLSALPLLHMPLARYLRPELFALVALAALLHLLGEHERRGGKGPLAGALLVTLLWANVHGSVSLGLFVVGCYALDRGATHLAKTRDPRGAFAWAALPIAALAASCVSPRGLAGPLAFRILRPTWIAITPEWQALPEWPPLLHADSSTPHEDPS